MPAVMTKALRLSDTFKPHPRQLEAMQALDDHDFVLYGGAAGGGKSAFLRWALVDLLTRWSAAGLANVRVGLFSADYPTLHDRQLAQIRREFPDWLGTFHEQRREYELAIGNGGTICFRNLDDPSKYKSAEFAAIAVEELTEHPEEVFTELRWRLRWPKIERPKFLAATNPSGVGLHWVKRLWIDREFPENLKPKADQFVYIPARAADNKHLPASYVATLESLPPEMRRALLDGSWDIFSGQVFSEFKRDLHVVQPFEIPYDWTIWASNDPGYSDPGVWYLMAADHDGNGYIFEEFTFHRLSYSEQAKVVVAKFKTINRIPRYCVTGMDAFTNHPETGKCIANYYKDGGMVELRKPVHGPGARMSQAGTFHEVLRPFANEKGVTTCRVKIFENCKKLIQTLPTLPADDRKPEQVAECAVDHWFQAAAYGLQSRYAKQGKYSQTSTPGVMF